MFANSADEKKNKRSRQTTIGDEKTRYTTMWEILESDIVNTGSKAQIQKKRIALTEFLNTMLMNTTPREDAYDGLLCIMEKLPPMKFT